MKSNLLCLDYGTAWTGIAIATTPLAEPFQTIPTNQVISIATKLIKDHNINAIVIGLSENQMAKTTRQFAFKLKEIINLPIYFHDETLTSQEARLKLAQAQAKKNKKESKTDHFAATAILQDFIDTHRLDVNSSEVLDTLPETDKI